MKYLTTRTATGIRHDGVVLTKPGRLTFEQAASVPVAGFTALQALRDEGRIRPGHKVLVNGAAGGVGTFAVQIAKAFGGAVTGVCSTQKVEMIASIGADQVIDYTREDFTRGRPEYNLLIDIAGNRTLAETRRVLVPDGVLVGVGGPDKGRWIGPLGRSLRMTLLSPAVSQRMVSFLAHQNNADLAVQVTDTLRFVQLTPPGSACSIVLGTGITQMPPGSQKGVQCVVADVEAARQHLIANGVPASDVDVQPWGSFVTFSDPDGNTWALQQVPPWQ